MGECWYSINEVGGVTYANEAAALYIEMVRKNHYYLAKVRIQPVIEVHNVLLTICCDDKEVYKDLLDLRPANLIIRKLAVPSDKIILKVTEQSGKEIISWDCREYRTNPPEIPV